MRYSINDIVVLREDYASNSISKRGKMFAGKKCVITGELFRDKDSAKDVFEVRLYDKPEVWDSCSAEWIEGRYMEGVQLSGYVTDGFGRCIDNNKFLDEFIRWLDINDYQFCGTCTRYETYTDLNPSGYPPRK